MSRQAEQTLSRSSREALGRLIGSLANNKAAMGRRYGEWAVSAPTLESGVAAAAMAQDELGHARSTYPLLKQLGLAASEAEDRMDTTGCVPILAEPLPNWETFVAVNLVVDGMFTAFLEASADSSFAGLQQRARKILQQERSHGSHARAWSRRLANSPDGAGCFPAAVVGCWNQIAAWAGDPKTFSGLVADGAVVGTPDELREKVRQGVAEVVTETQLNVELV